MQTKTEDREIKGRRNKKQILDAGEKPLVSRRGRRKYGRREWQLG